MSLTRLDNASQEDAFYALYHLPNSAGMDSRIVFSRPEIRASAVITYLKECSEKGISPTEIKMKYDRDLELFRPVDFSCISEIVDRRELWGTCYDPTERKEVLTLLKDALLNGKIPHQVTIGISGLGEDFSPERLETEVVKDLRYQRGYELSGMEITLSKSWAGPNRGDDVPDAQLYYRGRQLSVDRRGGGDVPQKYVLWFETLSKRQDAPVQECR